MTNKPRKQIKSEKKTIVSTNQKKWFERNEIILSIIFIFSVTIYINTLWNRYAQDDAIVITDNMFTKQGFSGIPGLLAHDSFYGFFKKSGKDKLVAGGRYRPLSQASFAIEYQFFGLNPAISHLINILLYGLLCALIYLFLLELFNDKIKKSLLIVFAFTATILYSAHPVHTEVVANIKGRDELFSMFFSILALFLSVKWIKKGDYKYLIYIFISYILALFSKENSITIILVVPLMAYLIFKNSKFSYFKLIFPFLISAVLFLIVRTSILGFDFGGKSMELMNNPFLKFDGNKFGEFSLAEKLGTILFTLLLYIRLLIFPHPLTNDYYPSQIPMMNFGNWEVWLSLIMYIALLVFAITNLNKSKVLSFGILFFLLTLSIVSNFVFPVGTNMSERFLFMPSFGFMIVVGYLSINLFNKARSVYFIILIPVLILFCFKTFFRNNVWKDDFTLYTTDVKTSSNSAKALNAAGGSLVDAASKEKDISKKNQMLQNAIGYLDKAIEIHPLYANAYLLRSNAMFFQGKYDDAITGYKNLMTNFPENQEAARNLAIAYREGGQYYGEKLGQIAKALDYLQKSYQMDSTQYETVRLLGVASAFSGDKVTALKLFQKAIKIEPSNAGAYLNLGNAYYNLGDMENGKKNHQKALSLDPNILKQKN